MTRAAPKKGWELIEKHYDPSVSRMENARQFHEKFGLRSVKGWEQAMWKFHKKNPKPNEDLVQTDFDEAEGMARTNMSYHYDPSQDLYFTYLRVADQIITVEGDKHREMRQAYSNMVGKPASMNEICRRFGIPRAWFDEYRRRHNWTHDMDPFTDEEIESADPEQLVEDLVLMRRKHLHHKFERRRWAEIEKDAEAYRMFEDSVLNEFRMLIHESPQPVEKLDIEQSDNPYALVISPTDFHWGKHGWVDEVGETYDFDEARHRLFTKTEELVERLPSAPETIILATGSDWFHVDTDHATTTKGTAQDTCGSPAEILMTGCLLAREHIDLLRQVSHVDVVFMPGNHDRMSAIALMMYLSAVYENCEDVTIHRSPKVRHYMRYGNTLMGFIHGDGAKNLVEMMSNEQRRLWGECPHHVWFHGHLHHQKLTEKGGAMILQLPSLAGHDRYHYRQGYTSSQAGLAAHIIDYDLGLIGSMFAPVI